MKSIKKEMRLIVSTILINIKTIAIFGFLGFVISLLGTLIPIDNMYKASSAVCSTLFNDNWDNTKSVRLMASFMDVFESSLIQDKIINILDVSISRKELQNMTTMKTSNSKTILTITTRHKDPAFAIKTANVIAYILITETDKFFESSTGIKVMDKATEAEFAYKDRHIYILICFLSTFLFSLACCVYFIIKTLTSDKILFIEDSSMDGSLEIMGVIPFTTKKFKKKNPND